MKSPCIGCDHEYEDKNNDRCANCEKRIKYAQKEFMIPTEALEVDPAAREETKKIQDMAPPGKKRGRKPKEMAPAGTVTIKKKRGWPKGKKRGPRPKPPKEALSMEEVTEPTQRSRPRSARPRVQVNLHLSQELNIEGHEIVEELRKIAKLEFRRMIEQAFYFIKQGIDKWKEEHI